MAKATNKAASKKAATTKKMKNKITIDLTKAELSDGEKLALLRAVREAVSAKLKDKSREKIRGLIVSKKELSVAAAEPATVTVRITDAEPGKSEIIAEHNGAKNKLRQGGSMKFENVKKGDLIEIEGDSLGTVKFTIDRKAEPAQQTFKPLQPIIFHFRILE